MPEAPRPSYPNTLKNAWSRPRPPDTLDSWPIPFFRLAEEAPSCSAQGLGAAPFRARLSTCQRWGGQIEEIRPGDVVWFPPDERHWHGATPTVAMTHIAIQEALNGKVVDWMEHVSDEQ